MQLPEIFPLTDFRSKAAAHIKRLKKSDRPTMLTQNGIGTAVVMSPEHYERLAADAEIARSIAAIQESLSDSRADIPWAKVAERLRARHSDRKAK
jgi:prevent-host-death family protein